MNRKLLNITIK